MRRRTGRGLRQRQRELRRLLGRSRLVQPSMGGGGGEGEGKRKGLAVRADGQLNGLGWLDEEEEEQVRLLGPVPKRRKS